MQEKDEAFVTLKPLVDPTVRKALYNLPDDKISEEAVREMYENLVPGFARMLGPVAGVTLTDSEIVEFTELLINQYLHEMPVNKPNGFAYKSKECIPWVREIQDDEWYFWERYEQYLTDVKGWERKVVKSMADDTLNILDLMADPRKDDSGNGADRRGLVVADVQSGKTSNYIGVMSRAADAGYRVIVVLAGIYNVLRSQTQQRIEEGFTGLRSTDNKPVGVGLISSEKRWNYGTSRIQDFGRKRLQAMMGTGGNSDNWIFVIKKNKSVLESLIEWLQTHPEIKGPLLLIDDEADNASINVKYAQDDVSAINGLIRKLLKQFHTSSYVGYTATPFANIFIDPNAETDNEGEDIFPRSFIYTLESSTTYFGAEKVLQDVDEEDRPRYVRFITDIEDALPSRHKKDTVIPYLPSSLAEAVRAFVISSTIRKLRGDGNQHTTMMVNVSPYTAVQAQVTELVKDYLRTIRIASRNYALLPEALKNPFLSDIHDTWLSEYSDCEFNWLDVCRELYDVIRVIDIVLINSASKDVLDYDKPNGEHVIAIGGYRLSRGLTLEGLLISYYSRNARAYDTLMQMARWYGYRPGYEDLCRIWMTRDAANWYAFVSDATVELISQLRNMRQLNSDPSMYGLMVRQSPKALMITARNKRGVGQIEKKPTNLNDSFVETTALLRDDEIVAANFKAADSLVDALLASGAPSMPDTKSSVGFTNVPPELVKDFIAAYTGPEYVVGQPQRNSILASIDKLSGYLADPTWDVVIVSGSEDGKRGRSLKEKRIGSRTIYYEGRFPGRDTNPQVARVGNKSRLSSRDVEAFGLTADEKKDVEKNYRTTKGGTNTPGVAYRQVEGKKPLLVVHYIWLRFKLDSEGVSATYNDLVDKKQISGWSDPSHGEPSIGWSISYPNLKDPHLLEFDYMLNGPAITALYGMNEDYDEDDPDEP